MVCRKKSTELGISQITPLVCEYSEKRKSTWID